jgi:cysteine synthase
MSAQSGLSYEAVMSRKNEIMLKSVGIDYSAYSLGPIAFDYERMMRETAYEFAEIQRIQREVSVGNTPLIELRNITRLIRQISPAGKGARIFVKDEACNPSGSFKARRASVSVYHAKKMGYPGIITATSGNYGAAVASQAAMKGLKCIVVQEIFDSRGIGQPEIIEKGRACEAYGAQVMQLTVGPELFYVMLRTLEETGFFNASLYTPFSISGIETLGYELVQDVRRLTGRDPDMVVVTHAGGGNITGTVRGIRRAEARNTRVTAASVDLSSLHMASDRDFNRKSFTTGHTGFGVPFAVVPDRSDVPRNAARPLRYMERYVTVTQGEVFYTTEMLAQLEGLERGPAGNTALAAAVSLAREMDQEQILVVQETEYTGAGKHPSPQLTFARKMGVEVKRGDPRQNAPGKTIVIPEDITQISARDMDMDDLRARYLRHAVTGIDRPLEDFEERYLAEETGSSTQFVRTVMGK